jgi:hypothetical protein
MMTPLDNLRKSACKKCWFAKNGEPLSQIQYFPSLTEAAEQLSMHINTAYRIIKLTEDANNDRGSFHRNYKAGYILA